MSYLINWFNGIFDDCNSLIAQGVGFIPFVLSYFVFLFNDRRKIVAFKTVTDLFWALHFIMLGEVSGAVTNLLNTVRNIVFSQKDKKWCKNIIIPVFFCLVTILGNLISKDGIKSLFPAVGSCLAVMGFWCNNPKNIRRFNLPALLLWLIYGFITMSVSTVICNILSIASILTAIFKERTQKRKENL